MNIWSYREFYFIPIRSVISGVALLSLILHFNSPQAQAERFQLYRKDHSDVDEQVNKKWEESQRRFGARGIAAGALQTIGEFSKNQMSPAQRAIEDAGGKVIHSSGLSSTLTVEGFRNEAEVREALGELSEYYSAKKDPLARLRARPVNISNFDLYGLNTIRADKVWPSAKGNGISVAVIDTGVNDLSHLRSDSLPEFGNRLLPGKSFVVNDPSPEDRNGHGTHVAGTVGSRSYGVAPNARILPIKAIDAQGYGYESDAIAALEYAVEQGADVVNISLGWPASESDLDGWETILDVAEKAGVTVVAATGNAPDPREVKVKSPAVLDNLIAVGATDEHNRVASFSLYRDKDPSNNRPDVCAPGVNIESIGGAWDGTSMATPHVAGAVALMLSMPGGMYSSPKDIKDRLVETAQSQGDPDKYGAGVVDVFAAIGREPGPRPNPHPAPDVRRRYRMVHRKQMRKLDQIESSLKENLRFLQSTAAAQSGHPRKKPAGHASHPDKQNKDKIDLTKRGLSVSERYGKLSIPTETKRPSLSTKFRPAAVTNPRESGNQKTGQSEARRKEIERLKIEIDRLSKRISQLGG